MKTLLLSVHPKPIMMRPLGPSSAAIQDLHFRPPAIPLITADPFMQTFIWGDNSSGPVRHWDGVAKSMRGLVRIDGATYSFLGACNRPFATKLGPVDVYDYNNVAPGQCDLGDVPDLGDDDCNLRCYSNPSCAAYVRDGNRCWLKSCASPLVPSGQSNSSVLTGPHPPCDVSVPTLTQRSVVVYPTRTVFALELPAKLSLTLTFVQSAFAEDAERLSRPVYYARLDAVSIDSKPHSVQLYLDASAEFALNSCRDQQAQWSSYTRPGLRGVRIGSQAQKVLGSRGDRVNIDWGYLHLAATDPSASVWAGSASGSRRSFASTGE